MQFAVIKTGGKQYLVRPGQKLKIEKLDGAQGDGVLFDEVLLVANGDEVKIGSPQVQGARVEAKVLRQARAKKVIIFKYRPKARSRVKKGHRQHFTEVEITKITK
ncbi:MAG: 50S ribosomal protein L21 [Candidatus Sungiibacteriota bacterium]